MVGALASLSRRTTASPGKGEGKIRISQRDREAAQKAVGKIGLPGQATTKGRVLAVPSKTGGGLKIRKRWPAKAKPSDIKPWYRQARSRSLRHLHRFSALTGPASLPTYPGESISHDNPHYLSSEQVGYIISRQHHNLPKHYTAREMEAEWTASTLYELTTIPSWVATPYRRIEPGDHSRSGGPIIVDAKIDDFHKYFGSFGQNIDVVVLDGKHRLKDMIDEHGDCDIDAFVGIEALPIIREYIKNFGPKRRAFVEALDSYYDNPDRDNRHDLASASRHAGLSKYQLKLIFRNFRKGWLFSPSLGEFVRKV
jgi:hypothetical protein